jgi:exo-beta-1,3-glucanase (GH17 family)
MYDTASATEWILSASESGISSPNSSSIAITTSTASSESRSKSSLNRAVAETLDAFTYNNKNKIHKTP